MAFEEKQTWAYLVITVTSYLIYLVTILGRLGDAEPTDVVYVETFLWTIGGAIIAAVVARLVLVATAPEEVGEPDERDRAIYHRSEYIGQSLVVVGGVAALAMSLWEVPHFWIANAVYLCFTLAAVLGGIARIVAYRSGFQSW